jgi:diacylglycerol kinase
MSFPPDSKVEEQSLQSGVDNPFRARHFLESLGFALAGLRFVFRTQRNFRTHVVITLGVLLLGALLGLSSLEWAALLLVIGLVLLAELMNTAIEYTVDLYTQGAFDPRAKVIKDIAAGACLLMAVCAVGVGGCVFGPHLWGWIDSYL